MLFKTGKLGDGVRRGDWLQGLSVQRTAFVDDYASLGGYCHGGY